MGDTCTPMTDSFVNVWQTPLQYGKVISLQLKKKKKKKLRWMEHHCNQAKKVYLLRF